MSLRSRLLIAWYRLIREKRTWDNLHELADEVERSHQPKQARPPRWLTRRYQVDTDHSAGFPCHTARRPGGGHGPRILHLHGGAYVQQIAAHHWRYLAWLIDELDCAITVPLYPLAPEHHVTDTLPAVREVYDRMLRGVDPERRVLMGDSAGGGMCLALAQGFRDEGHPQPRRIVLISPWLDVTMDDPSVPAQDRRDPYLGAEGLAVAGRWYAGAVGVRDPSVSPLFGRFDGLAPLAVFIGTADVLLADSRRLRAAAEQAGLRIDYHEYPNMIHNWPMRRLPEGDQARRQIARLLVEG